MRYLIVLLTVLAAGCMSVGNKQLEDPELVKKIVPGTSTKADVRALAGEPTETEFSDTGEETWKYVLTKGQTRAASFVPVVGLFAGGMDMQTHTLTVRFKGDVVSRVGSGKSTGGAGGVQD